MSALMASEALGISVTRGMTSSSSSSSSSNNSTSGSGTTSTSTTAGSSNSSSGGGGASTLMPTVTRVEPRLDVNPLSVIIAISIVFILSPITISSNTMILAAFYRYKRLRTASNCLLASLAVSDFGVGVFMPFGMHLELSGLPDNLEVSTLCIVPYSIAIALCSVSVLVTVAIAVDRLTSLAQPLRYKNIITHSSVEKYIAFFWLYSIGVGLSPLIYAHIMGLAQSHGGSCRFNAAIRPPVQIFLIVAVWAPSALVLLCCYMYVYLVARAHARAIYTVELSFRHETQTMALPRYGQTLAVTVGAFLILWLPFQACMLLDIICGTKILSEWAVVWLGLPILAHSAANPWIYAFHHVDMRVAATKIAEDVVTRFGIHPSRYGCSPARHHRGGSNSNLELAEVNKSHESRQPPEDCFAAKHFTSFYSQREKSKCQNALSFEWVSSDTDDISPEGAGDDSRRRRRRRRRGFSLGGTSRSTANVVEENIDDLAKMLRPEYAIDRNHKIDSNLNMDKMKNLRYMIDPTLNKIRQLKRLNENKGRYDGKQMPKFTSYQNLDKLNRDDVADAAATAAENAKTIRVRRSSASVSDPILGSAADDDDSSRAFAVDYSSLLIGKRRRNVNLASMSDPNFKRVHGRMNFKDLRKIYNQTDSSIISSVDEESLRNEERSHSANRYNQSIEPKIQACVIKIRTSNGSNKQITLMTRKKLANFADSMDDDDGKVMMIAESTRCSRLLERSLVVPAIHSEPPSPVDSRLLSLEPLIIAQNNSSPKIMSLPVSSINVNDARFETDGMTSCRDRSPSGFSEDHHSSPFMSNPCISIKHQEKGYCGPNGDGKSGPLILPEELAAALVISREDGTGAEDEGANRRRPASGTIFAEHDSTRFTASRRPSDLRWFESSRSQEVLSNSANEHHHDKSPSSYSFNYFESRTSGSDLNDDITCLGSFVCPDALTSSLRESFFETPSSLPDDSDDVFTSFEDLEQNNPRSGPRASYYYHHPASTGVIAASSVHHYSLSSVNLERSSRIIKDKRPVENNVHQSKSTESVSKNNHHRAISRPEASVMHQHHRSRPRIRPSKADYPSRWKMAPLATPIDISTPTYDSVNEIRGASSVLGVRV